MTMISRKLYKYTLRNLKSVFNRSISKREHDAGFNTSSCYLTNFKPSIRIQNVVGFNDRLNDVLYCPPLIPDQSTVYTNSPQHGIVIFFGGDMQDFHENMISEEKTKEFVDWSLENTAKLLSMHYKNCHILIVRPSSIEEGIYSSYSNFVPSFKYGEPRFIPNHGSLLHLSRLIANLQETLKNTDIEEIGKRLESTGKILESKACWIPTEEEYRKNLNHCYIELIGFSKGCVVLNQFLYEFHHFKKSEGAKTEKIVNLIDRIKTMRWLDGGHGGWAETWITSEEVLGTYAEMGKQTFVHVTPYQVFCSKRPWIGKEEDIFTRILTEKKVEITRKLHMGLSKGTLKNHFNLLQEVFSNTT